MSVIRKKPYIATVIESLTDLAGLQTILNSGGSNVSIDFNNIPQAESQAGYFENKSGIWLNYSDDNACFISYDKSQTLRIYDINLETHIVTKIEEYLSITELRMIVSTLAGSGGGAFDEYFTYDDETHTLICGANFQVDGVYKDTNGESIGTGTVKQLAAVPENPTASDRTFIYVDGVLYVLVDDEYQGV